MPAGTPIADAYAGLSDLQAYLGYDPPVGWEAKLRAAKRLLDAVPQISWIRDRWRYRTEVRGQGIATETQIAEALCQASCAQLEYWLTQGGGVFDDSQDILRLTQPGRLDGETMPALPALSPRAKDILVTAGVWASGPDSWGLWW